MKDIQNGFVDYFDIGEMLTDEQNVVRESTRKFVERKIMPVVDDAAQEHKALDFLNKELAEHGAFGCFIPEKYGGAGLDYVSYGLMAYELERGDSAVRSAVSVQSSLVMFPIYTFGNENQRKKYLPKLAYGEMIGAFGLTEPNHGSDPGAMETKIIDKGNHYLLNGSKAWITNAPVSDMAIVWAKDENDKVRGLIVERSFEGFTTVVTEKKWSLRASHTGEMFFKNVEVPKENMLPNISGLKGPLMCLNSARYGIAWGVLGAAENCLQTALNYSLERHQFQKPIASFQLTQKKLAEMLTELTKSQLMAWRLGILKDNGTVRPQQISMAKRSNAETALKIARESRQILGAMGISGDFPIMRHMMNLESVITYEGTHDIHLLITGADITGISAFY
jgi:glutaryl-CoA dehydrogenase